MTWVELITAHDAHILAGLFITYFVAAVWGEFRDSEIRSKRYNDWLTGPVERD